MHTKRYKKNGNKLKVDKVFKIKYWFCLKVETWNSCIKSYKTNSSE